MLIRNLNEYDYFLYRKSLKAAKKVHEAHEGEIRTLEEELAEVEKSQQEFEEKLAEESKSKGRDLTLQDSQVILKIRRLYFFLMKDIKFPLCNCKIILKTVIHDSFKTVNIVCSLSWIVCIFYHTLEINRFSVLYVLSMSM